MPLKSEPYLSVIVPVYNGGHQLESCLDALLAASFPACEIIVVDDASTDGSATAARARSRSYSTDTAVRAGVGTQSRSATRKRQHLPLRRCGCRRAARHAQSRCRILPRETRHRSGVRLLRRRARRDELRLAVQEPATSLRASACSARGCNLLGRVRGGAPRSLRSRRRV